MRMLCYSVLRESHRYLTLYMLEDYIQLQCSHAGPDLIEGNTIIEHLFAYKTPQSEDNTGKEGIMLRFVENFIDSFQMSIVCQSP